MALSDTLRAPGVPRRGSPATPAATRYATTAVVLHWLIALGILAQIALGWWMIDLPKSPPGLRAGWFNLHKSIGITVGVLALVQLARRAVRPPPPLPATLARWQQRASRLVHTLLYGCLVAMPLSGVLGSMSTRYPIRYFGVVLPLPSWDHPAAKEVFSAIHLGTAILLMALLALHVGAALMHLARRDGIVSRMLPGRR